METFNFTKAGYAYHLGNFQFYWISKDTYYEVTHYGRTGIICQVHPYKGEEGTLGQDSKMFTVIAHDYPGVGKLEQMVKGADLLEYIDSIRMGRGM